MRRAWVVVAVLVAVGVLVVGAFVAIKFRSKQPGPAATAFEPSEAAEIVEARQTSWQPTADLVGTVFAVRSVTVRNELAGVVRFVGFDSGQTVEAGQVLLRQDDSSERADLEAMKAAVRVAESNVVNADAQIALARAELDRYTGLQTHAAVAELEIDRARTRLDSERAQRGRWAAEVDQARARVAQVEARIAKLTLTAPFRARAGLRSIHEGQYLAEGTDVVALQELTDTIYLDFAIPQEYAPRVRVGTTVEATAELLGPDPVEIRVVAIDATVNNATRNLRIRAEVDNTRGTLVPGMAVNVSVPIERQQSLVTVPSTAVRRAAYGNSIFVIAPDDKGALRAHQRFVTLGHAVGESVIVLDGLKVGERVAAAGSFKLRDGVLVLDQPPAPAGAHGAPAGETASTAGGA